ncbi:hypothetical protein Golomagni_06424, partial [Golovinomyces magnicellulatus]
MQWLTKAAILALIPFVSAGVLEDRKPHIAKTVTLANGQVIDWVYRDSQGQVATPPPFQPEGMNVSNVATIHSFAGHEQGPAGTVPFLRNNGHDLPMKMPPHKPKSRIAARQYRDRHWYASTAQTVNNHGTTGTFSMFKAYVQSNNDFSLIQTAVERNGVPGVGGSRLQTLEAGWINYPNQRRNPHLFTFFTTNGHQEYADNICSWNTDYKGWIQSDNTYYPGMEMTPLSVVNGEQHDLAISYQLFQGNWWFNVNGKWIGYYPANLFTRNGNTSGQTLESQSDQLNWYGEIYQSEDSMTTTDMGSGHYANEGRGKSAYIRNIAVVGTDGNSFNYD